VSEQLIPIPSIACVLWGRDALVFLLALQLSTMAKARSKCNGNILPNIDFTVRADYKTTQLAQ
jgi:hypothetical protein